MEMNLRRAEKPGTYSSPRPHVVGGQRFLIPDVEPSGADDGVGPGGFAVRGELEAAVLAVGLGRALGQDEVVAFAQQVEHSVGHAERALPGSAVLPGDLAGLELHAD